MKKLILGLMTAVLGVAPIMGAQLYSSAPSMQQKTYILQVSGGHSIFIENSDFTTTLINAGKSIDSQFIVDYIKGLGHSRIDTVIGTQNLSDSGLDEVVEEFRVGSILMANGYRPDLFKDLHEIADDKGIKIKTFDLDEIIDDVNVLLAQQPIVTYPPDNDMSVAVPVPTPSFEYGYDNDMSVGIPVPTPGYWYDNDQVGGGYVVSPGQQTYPYDNDMSVGVPVPDPGLWYDNDQVGGGYVMSPVPTPGYWYDNDQVGGGYVLLPGQQTYPYDNDMSVGLPVPTPAPVIGGTVYRTNTGSTYHAAGCEHANSTIYAISLTDAVNLGLQPCPYCY
ncbi:hypothetical protein AN396_11930 [Candidatus Epulonipiscium fishelsonii]|uniref:Uncharacterized protein n=1 Tax=Candidatus Epulonipiscium fishelsonii TaxID=77094 RepID=A0ACC8X7T7_9FIRM|nr:hypothetical protein AN396_11930 [Epulopiscium sp. SCG-B11WGA-EpuloA1]